MDTAFAVTDELVASIADTFGDTDEDIIRAATKYQRAKAAEWFAIVYNRRPTRQELAEELRTEIELDDNASASWRW